MTLAAKLVLIMLCCMCGTLLLQLGQLIARKPAARLRGLLSAILVVGLVAYLLAVAAFVLG